MKEQELREHADCNLCGNPIGAARVPLFWVVTVQRYGLEMRNIQAQDGLAAMLGGSSELAAVMGTNKDLATELMEVKVTVCETCALERSLPIAAIAERGKEVDG